MVLAYAAWWLGKWQFHRLHDRKGGNVIWAPTSTAPPPPSPTCSSRDDEPAGSDEWRLVTATGTYDAGGDGRGPLPDP